MPLTIVVDHATAAGQRSKNEDFVAVITPGEIELARKGCIGAIADGVSGHVGGREAAECTVRNLLADYYATPDAWTPAEALERVLARINAWVIAEAQRRRELTGMATTVTALVLRGSRYTIAHAGDSRAYLQRGGELARLTRDHVWERADLRHVLTRAVGLDSSLNLDIHEGELAAGDRWVLLTDGVWSVLPEADLIRQLAAAATPGLAQALVDQAQAAGAKDDASALVLEIVALGEDNLQDVAVRQDSSRSLPRLAVGAVVDDLRIDALLHESAATRLYRVTDLGSRRLLVLKTLTEESAADPVAREHFSHEEWIARRAVARYFPQVVSLESGRQSALYYLQTWHPGRTLSALLESGGHLTVPEAIRIATALVRAIGALHRRSILHRDLKPENLHLGDDDELRVLDFGVAQTLREAAGAPRSRAGTPSYLAPELLEGAPATPQTDLYAAGVTLYHGLTRHYPYGEVEPFQRPRFGTPTSPARYRPDLPPWLENVLLKAVAREPRTRFETAEEFLLALERGAAHPIPAVPPEPLALRHPRRTWQLLALASLLANLILLYLLLVGLAAGG